LLLTSHSSEFLLLVVRNEALSEDSMRGWYPTTIKSQDGEICFFLG